jgi:shikimate kinase
MAGHETAPKQPRGAPRDGEPRGCVLLAGMMGSGKSAVGGVLARRLGWRFIDTDSEIEAAAGASVAQIFAREGEARFREREREALAALPGSGAVVSLGGGAVVDARNREILAGKGTLVWLDASPEALAARTAADSSRPLLAGLDHAGRVARLRELAAARRPAYAQAAFRIDTEGRTPAQVADAIVQALASGAPR